MTDKLWNVVFGANSLLKQAYVWFYISLLIIPLGYLLPTNVVVKLVYVLSCLALTISAQAFIAAAKANKRLEDDAEDTQEEIEELKDDVDAEC